MRLATSVTIALNALRLNALRSFLTMLGIIIGVAAVIVMVSISNGAQQQVEAVINSLGTNILMVRPGAGFMGRRSAGAGTDKPFSEKDFETLQKEVEDVYAMTGSLTASAPVISGNINWLTSIQGGHVGYLKTMDWELASGRNYTDQEVRSAAKVAILGQTVVEELFGDADPLGQRIRIKKIPFTVIGVLQEKGQNAFGRDQDDIVIIPISTARKRIAGRDETVPDQVPSITIKMEDWVDLDAAKTRVEDILRERRKIKAGDADDFGVHNLSEMVKARTSTETTLSVLLAATAAISLIVGGIGIMNIMLVSVTERTREIGLRLSVGARKRDILQQFLVEGITLCLIGGLIGIVIGVGATVMISQIGNWPIVIGPSVILLAIGAAAAVGIFFGYYPAHKAANLNPIDALRYE
ncbi:ABC transporter permease [Emcibacter nanhaiensis]|uniref:FtsX-like permease family protein n=1 Tax=Emcibacter nanhaiensis TaxID=1505037 RepID=A0A501PS01_9PROT|nr:ABC transporter permease [Emcibacter nanhaiensis]TPD63015.1 FtsX-like permease family protein [Emcibacter nanhaiensis]